MLYALPFTSQRLHHFHTTAATLLHSPVLFNTNHFLAFTNPIHHQLPSSTRQLLFNTVQFPAHQPLSNTNRLPVFASPIQYRLPYCTRQPYPTPITFLRPPTLFNTDYLPVLTSIHRRLPHTNLPHKNTIPIASSSSLLFLQLIKIPTNTRPFYFLSERDNG